MKTFLPFFIGLALISIPTNVSATEIVGKIIETKSHVNISCRSIKIRQENSGMEYTLRISDTSENSSMILIAIAAQTSGLKVVAEYSSDSTNECGSEPTVMSLSMKS